MQTYIFLSRKILTKTPYDVTLIYISNLHVDIKLNLPNNLYL